MRDKKRFAVGENIRVIMPGVNGVVVEVDSDPTFLGEYRHTVRTKHGERKEFGCNLELVPRPMTDSEARAAKLTQNINVQGSVVGTINTGEVQRIDVAIDHIRIGGDPALAQSLTQFTEALSANAELAGRCQEEVLEQLSFLITQTATPEGQRKPRMIRSVLEAIGKAASSSTALITLWEKLHPLLAKALSL
jgi:hypothetical protein